MPKKTNASPKNWSISSLDEYGQTLVFDLVYHVVMLAFVRVKATIGYGNIGWMIPPVFKDKSIHYDMPTWNSEINGILDLTERREILIRRAKLLDKFESVNHSSSNLISARGLRNHGQICFANSALQALVSLPCFIEYLKSIVRAEMKSRPVKKQQYNMKQKRSVRDKSIQTNSDDTFTFSLLSMISSLLHFSCSGSNYTDVAPFNPKPILELMSKSCPQFRTSFGGNEIGIEQQDAQEFLASLLGILVKDAEECGLLDTNQDHFIETSKANFNYDVNEDRGCLTLNKIKMQEKDLKDVNRTYELHDKKCTTIDTTALDGSKERVYESAELRVLPTKKTASHAEIIDFCGEEKKKDEDGYRYEIESNSSLSHLGKDAKTNIDYFHDDGSKQHLKKKISDKKQIDENIMPSKEFFSNQNNIDKSDSVAISQRPLVDVTHDRMLSTQVKYAVLPPSRPKESPTVRMLSSLGSTCPSPFTGWLGSCLRCQTCQRVRPIRNSPFFDLPLIPTSVHQNTYKHNTSSCTLGQCLSVFVSVEHVADVDCNNCGRLKKMNEIEEDLQLLKNTITSMKKRGKGPEITPETYKELAYQQSQYDTLAEFAHDYEEEDDRIQHNEDDVYLKNNVTVVPQRGGALKCLLITRLPAILCLHIQRRYYNNRSGRMEKIQQHVVFPEVLDMSKYCAYSEECMRPSRQKKVSSHAVCWAGNYGNHHGNGSLEQLSSNKMLYRLMSVVEHKGNAHSGHYQTYRRLCTERGHTTSSNNKFDKWAFLSDEHVAIVNWNQVCQCQAYMLFYEAM
mmetsp:Transcript_8889/g.10290  ORF Transcript_8889/g.10290 Transcript_8889/m.10290 type:complete len:793 (+) Transcript_8889:106-2484(+)